MSFTAYPRIAVQPVFKGIVRQRTNLIAALDASAAPGAGPRLLVVGAPGHGKTTALLEIAQHLQTTLENRFGMPVVFNLGSWAPDDDDLVKWIVRELCGTTGVVPGADDAVRAWIKAGWIAPMLDGLDEITESSRRWRCVRAINGFIDRAPPLNGLVVTSRPDEYTEITEEGADRLAVNAAITLGRLKSSDVVARLRQSPTADHLADLVERSFDHPVAELLHVPLWLWTTSMLDEQQAIGLVAVKSGDEAQEILTGAFLDRSIVQMANRRSVSAEACRRFFAVLAGFLADGRTPDTATFRVEDLTSSRPCLAFRLRVATQFGSLFGLVVGVAVGVATNLAPGFIAGLSSGALLALFLVSTTHGRPARSYIRWPEGKQFITRLVYGLAWGLVATLPVGLTLGLVDVAVGGVIGGISFGLVYGLVNGIAGGLAFGLAAGLATSVNIASDRLDQGRETSRRSVTLSVATLPPMCSLAGGLVFGVAGVLTGTLAVALTFGSIGGLFLGLLFGLGYAFESGGWYLLLQHRMRRQAALLDLLPDDVTSFLLAGVEARILRLVGGGVQFRHRTLADHLAREAPTPGLAHLREAGGVKEGSRLR